MNCSILMFTNSLAGGGRDFGTISKERIQMDCYIISWQHLCKTNNVSILQDKTKINKQKVKIKFGNFNYFKQKIW